MHGVITDWSSENRYGFVKPKKGRRLFVHHSEINETDAANLKTGDEIAFDVYRTEMGAVATNVRLAKAGDLKAL